MSRIRISVIMPCYNHGAYVREAVDSVRSAGREEMELIVVDDGSTDARTRGEIDKLAAEGVHVIRQENKGLAGARNAAIAASSGEYIFPLDADDRMRSGWMARAIEILDTNGRVGVVYGDAQCFGTREFHWRVGALDKVLLLSGNQIHASALYRRRIWEENGGYDGTMPVQGLEDWDMWLGAFEHCWEFAYIPEVFFEYRQTEGSMTAGSIGSVAAVEFIARKHGLLYRRAWLESVESIAVLKNERESIKRTARDLHQLVGRRLKWRFGAMRHKT